MSNPCWVRPIPTDACRPPSHDGCHMYNGLSLRLRECLPRIAAAANNDHDRVKGDRKVEAQGHDFLHASFIQVHANHL